MTDARIIASRLVTEVFVARKDLPDLALNQVLYGQVKDRLNECGLELVESAFSNHYTVRPTVDAKTQFQEDASNVRLTDREAALLVVLWCKLSWPERQGLAGPHTVAPETLVEEFGADFNGKQNLLTALGRLTTLGFVTVQDGLYHAGPQLTAAVDADVLNAYVQDRARLVEVGARARSMIDTTGRTAHAAMRSFFNGTNEHLAPRDVVNLLGLDKDVVMDALRDLHKEGFLERGGQGKAVKYWRKSNVPS